MVVQLLEVLVNIILDLPGLFLIVGSEKLHLNVREDSSSLL